MRKSLIFTRHTEAPRVIEQSITENFLTKNFTPCPPQPLRYFCKNSDKKTIVKESEMLVQGFDHFVVPVNDVVVAEDFYAQVFGGKVVKRAWS